MATTSTDRLDSIVSVTIDAASNTQVTSTGSTAPRTLGARFAEVINVKDYGAVGDGSTDDSAAFAAAIAAANAVTFVAASSAPPTTTATLFIPPGNYKINTGVSVVTCNLRIATNGKESVRLTLAAGVVFCTVTGAVYRFDCVNALTTEAGKGFFQQTYAGSNVQGFVNINGNAFYDYTGSAVGSLSSDFPYWSVKGNIFMGSSALTSFGVVLVGDNTGTEITGNAFLRNKYHVKCKVLGNNYLINHNDFIRFTSGAGSPPLTDIWIVPNSSATNAGNNILISANKFGNENLNAADYRILVADEGSGTNAFDKSHSTSASIGYFVGWESLDNYVAGISSNLAAYVYSYTPNLRSYSIRDNNQATFNYYPTQYDAGASFSTEDRTIDTNFYYVDNPIDGIETLLPLATNKSTTIVRAADPLALTSGVEFFPTVYTAGADPSFVNLLTDTLITGGTLSNATKSNITDARAGANAITLTATATNGLIYLHLNKSNIVAGKQAWIEIDVKQAGSLPSNNLEIALRLDSDNTIAFRRHARVPSTWTTLRFPWIPKQNSSDLSLWLSVADYSAGVITKVNLGLPRVYHAHEPINFGSNYLQNSATYDPPSLGDGVGTTTTVTVTGAALGDYALASFSLDLQGISVTAYVSSADTVSVRLQNESGGTLDLSSGTLNVRVYKL